MIWLRAAGFLIVAAVGIAAWLLIFNSAVIVTHAQIGFCRNAAELAMPEPDCPAPWWYWAGNIIVPLVILIGAIRKIIQAARDGKA